MKVKNVKMIEQHVEKAVLAVAVAAAAYLGYSAFSSPVTADHNSSPVKASEVTREINTSVENLRRDLAKNAEQQQPVTIEDFVGKYKAIANQPLPVELTKGVASFTPLNMGPPAGVGPSSVNVGQLAILTPEVPAPVALTAEVSRGSISHLPPPAPGGDAAPPAWDPKDTPDMEWVMLKATYPMSKLVQAMTATQNRIPAEAQRYTFARVEAERQKQNPDGTWPTRWEPVPPAASVELPSIQLAANAETDAVKKILDDLDNGWVSVLRPPFYRIVTPPLQMQVVHVPVTPPAGARRGPVAPPPAADVDTAVAGTGDTAAPAPVAPPVRRGPPPKPVAVAPAPVAPAAPATPPPVDAITAAESLPPDQGHQALVNEANVPIWFYDEHVKGGERYRYRMRLAIFNPLFHLDMQLKDPNAKNLPWLRSDWAVLPEPVMVDSNSQMFVVRGSLSSKPNAVSFQLFRWQHGHWFSTPENVSPGETVGKPQKPSNFSENIDFDTGYTVVSVDQKGGETRVVLQGPNGELVTRDSLVDQQDPVHRRLSDQITKESTPTTQPAAPPAGT